MSLKRQVITYESLKAEMKKIKKLKFTLKRSEWESVSQALLAVATYQTSYIEKQKYLWIRQELLRRLGVGK